MNAVVSGYTANNYLAGKAILKSVTITDDGVGAAKLEIYDGQDVTSAKKLTVKSSKDLTGQVHFFGLAYPNGFTIVPVSNVLCYIVEYDQAQ